MFFSDELIAIGRKSNKKNNLSMNEALHTILEKCAARVQSVKPHEKELIARNVRSSFNLAMNTLQKEGYTYFTPERFSL